MSKEIIRNEIDQILETIAEQWDIIRGYNGKIPLIEMDILMGNVRKLYDDLYLLDKMNKTPGFDPDKIRSQITREPSIVFETGIKQKPPSEEPKEENREELPVPESVSPEPVIEPQQEPFIFEPEAVSEPEENSQPEMNEMESGMTETYIHSEQKIQTPETMHTLETEITNIQEELIVNEIFEEPEPIVVEPMTQKKPAQMPVTDLFGNPAPTIADKYQSEKKSVKDQLASNGNDNSLGNRMQQSQILDLKAAIGINDKFLFINELFKGDLAGYNRSIESLNACQTRDEAIEKLNEMRLHYNWTESSSSFSRLNDFLKRRYVP